MKILLVNKYHYVRGGSETYYFGLAELLKKAGHEVIFFAMNDEKNVPCEQSKYFIENVEFNGVLSPLQKIKAGFKMVYSFEAKRKIGQLMDDEKPDIVHINLFHRVHTASIVDAAKKRNIPVVFTMHDLNPICPNHTMLDHGKICEDCLHGNYLCCAKRVCFKDSRLKCIMAALESGFNKISGLYQKIDLFITPSEFYKKKLEESGLTKNRIVCLRNFLPEGTEFSANESKGEYFLYFGRLSEEKGVLTLLKAVKQTPEVCLEIAGTGPQTAELQEFVTYNGLSDRVHFNGFLMGEPLKKLVREAKCIVLPSEWYENGPYTIMEAMASGKPVIVSSLGGLPEIVLNNRTGYICDPFSPASLARCIEKMERLPDNRYLEMAKTALNFSQKEFSAGWYLKKIEEHYAALCNMQH